MTSPSNAAAEVALPVFHEDDLEGDMGQTSLHTLCCDTLHYGIGAHLAPRPEYAVYANLNFHYNPRFPRAYVSPDVMALTPKQTLQENLSAYRMGQDGPAPVLVVEVLSERIAEDRDLDEKPKLYALLGVAEYLLVDATGEFLPQRLLLKQLQPDGTWKDEQDADGGVTSALGFRVVIDAGGRLRVVDRATGHEYVRPDEADRRVRELEAEIARLRAAMTGKP